MNNEGICHSSAIMQTMSIKNRTSPVCNEELDALVINGTRTHNLDYERIRSLANDILAPVFAGCDEERQLGIKCRKNHLSNNSLFANCFF